MPNEIQIQRIILLAEHLKKLKPQDYPVDKYCIENKMPYYIYENGLEFKFPPFIYTAMEEVFLYEWAADALTRQIIYLRNMNTPINEALMDFFGVNIQ